MPNKIPRSEYPRPQFVRDQWLNLNGEWEFEIDHGDSGIERGVHKRHLNSKIIVPFCPESSLSGIGNVDYMLAVWYRREVKIPSQWAGQRILLNFGAVDYDATVWVNGVEIARHRGGFTPFVCDLSSVADGGKTITIVIRARDDWRPPQPRGKQSQQFENMGCHYTRTTGIWQTVWLEPVPQVYLKRPRITPDVSHGMFRVEQSLSENRAGYSVRATLKMGKTKIATAIVPADADRSPRLDLEIPKSKRRLWSIEDPFLYDLRIELLNEKNRVVDAFDSYAGLRSVTIDGQAVKINGKAVFQRLVLDQGYWPDGIMTAPTDEHLIKDIQLSMAAGFNGARLHQKVFEERFLYHADKMGYICWGEFGDWGAFKFEHMTEHVQFSASYITQWLEAIERDYSHPSIVGWCPLNEQLQVKHERITAMDDVMRGMYLATKAMDTTRPVLDTSGWTHRVDRADIYDSHDYEQDPEKFYENHKGLPTGKPQINNYQGAHSVGYHGQPFFVSEFGGIWWNPKLKPGEPSWGYGDRPKSLKEFYDRFEKLCAVLLENPHMFGYCYTQLTDVFQEQNGVVNFDRTMKLDLAKLKAAQMRPAAMEMFVNEPVKKRK